MKKVIVFDLWKTLVGEPNNLMGYFQASNSSLQIDKAELKKAVEKSVMTKPIDLTAAVSEICRTFGITDSLIVDQIVKNWKLSCEQCYLFPDVLPMLESLKKSCQLALITNTSKYGWQQVERKFKLSRYFDLLVLSFEQGATKPDKKLFEYVEQKLSAQEYWMIGDSLKSDLEPAEFLGWQTILINRKIQPNIKDVILNKIIAP